MIIFKNGVRISFHIQCNCLLFIKSLWELKGVYAIVSVPGSFFFDFRVTDNWNSRDIGREEPRARLLDKLLHCSLKSSSFAHIFPYILIILELLLSCMFLLYNRRPCEICHFFFINLCGSAHFRWYAFEIGYICPMSSQPFSPLPTGSQLIPPR
jgi:hypothetical protein